MSVHRRQSTHGKTFTDDPNGVHALRIRGRYKSSVYQGTSKQFANAGTIHDPQRQVRARVANTNPKTPNQVIQQSKMAPAVAAWKQLTDFEKAEYNDTANKTYFSRDRVGRVRYRTGFTYFCSLHLRGLITKGIVEGDKKPKSSDMDANDDDEMNLSNEQKEEKKKKK